MYSKYDSLRLLKMARDMWLHKGRPDKAVLYDRLIALKQRR